MKFRSFVPLLAPALVATALAVAEEKPAPPPLAPAPSFAADIEPLLVDQCSSCHGARRQKAGLDLSAGRGFKALVGVESEMKPGMARVKPGAPEESILWLKLDFRPPAGDPMPKRFLFGPKKLPPKDLALIKGWIEGGAKE
jgi:hypothetical protein